MSFFDLYKKHLDELQTNNRTGVERKPIKKKLFDAFMDLHNTHQVKDTLYNYVKGGGEPYFWSDLHFGHKNITKYAGRPFSVDLFEQVMFDNYLSNVKNDDIVVFGGDIAFNSVTDISNKISTLPGYKILVVGNHDFTSKGKFLNYSCFDEICLFNHIEKNGQQFIISHYPIRVSFLDDFNLINIHGHTHNFIINSNKFINMCVENNNYSPTLLENLAKCKM